MWRNHDAALEEDAEPEYTSEISSFQSNAHTRVSELISLARTASKHHLDLDTKSLKELQEAENCDIQMRSFIQQMKREQTSTGYDRMNKQQVPGSPAAAVSDSDLNSNTANKPKTRAASALSGVVLGLSTRGLGEGAASFSKVETQAVGFQSSLSGALSSSVSAMGLGESLNVLQSSYKSYAQHFIQPGLVIKAREQQLLNRQSSDAERKEKERAAQSKWNEAQSLLQSMKTVPQRKSTRSNLTK